MSRFIASEVEHVPVGDLALYPGNARDGDIDAIAESLRVNGQYKPLLVQRSTSHVLTGNHTLLAARKLGWRTVAVAFVDVDDDEAKRIVVADNRTSDLGDYDDRLLVELLKDLPDLSGTGFPDDAVDQLLDLMADDGLEVDDLLSDDSPDDEDVDWRGEGLGDETLGGALPEVPVASGDDGADEERFEDIPDRVAGQVRKLDPNVFFASTNEWHIPQLLVDKIAEVPSPLDTWAGERYTPDDGESTWLYIYNVDSPKGLPYQRSLLAFYTFDKHFEQWWQHPDYYVQKALNAGIPTMVEPDFSIFEGDPRAIQLFNLYRRRWIGRFAQEAGIEVIPHVSWPDRDFIEFAVLGVPEGAQSISVQFHRGDDHHEEEETAQLVEEFHDVLDIIKPKQCLVYGGKQVHEVVQGMGRTDVDFTYAINRVAKHRKRFTKRRKLKVKAQQVKGT